MISLLSFTHLLTMVNQTAEIRCNLAHTKDNRSRKQLETPHTSAVPFHQPPACLRLLLYRVCLLLLFEFSCPYQ
jgi:hypothetical protein